jgi:porin
MPIRVRQCALGLAIAAASLGWKLPAYAQTASTVPPSGSQQDQPVSTPPGFWESSNLLDDPGGLRTGLSDHGISIGLGDVDEVLGNVTGGVHTGEAYDGITQFGLGVNTAKAFGWPGGIFNVSALDIRGSNLSTENLHTLQTASGIEAAATIRLWELWYQQSFAAGKADIKLGLQSVDQEFIISPQSLLFINTAMGWPVLPSVDLYAGGPAYPLSSLGVRLRVRPNDTWTVLSGVFQDNPPGGPFTNDSQLLGTSRWGGNFNLRTGALFMNELQYALNPSGALPGVYKLGFWYDTGPFPSPLYDTMGVSLANPASNGVARLISHNFSFYAVLDQIVWHPNPKSPRTLGAFLRIMGAPGDRNMVSFAVNGGFTMKAPLPGRDNDTVGFGFGLAHVSGSVAQFDQQKAFFTGAFVPVQTNETFLELTYQAQVAGWWVLQPDLQYVINPGGGLPNPQEPGKPIGNELVLGLRSIITF